MIQSSCNMRRQIARCAAMGLLCLTGIFLTQPAAAQNTPAAETGDAQWIWAAESERDNVPAGPAFFRKTFVLKDPETGRIEIAADDRYELFVNGHRVGAGQGWQRRDAYDIGVFLASGRNVIAVRVDNGAPGPAGLAAIVSVRSRGNTDIAQSTDTTWRAQAPETKFWQQPNFNDAGWPRAVSWGEYGKTAPWSNSDPAVANSDQGSGRFKAAPDFVVERVAAPEDTGSIIAMAFDELGRLILSRENGPLLMAEDKDQDGRFEAIAPWTEEVTNCQGILPLNGQIYAVGKGPEEAAFYRLSDDDHDGRADHVTTLFKFKGGMGEHGPHAPLLGPDGMIYLIVGNHSAYAGDFAPTSPHHHYAEDDLVQPKYEDAGGHAVGVKAPGGTVIRTDLNGTFAEVYCGGFRNAYDMAFDRHGDLFTYDSDMEWDIGLPWYRPTRLLHCTPGAEFGWRSGWSKWPEYFVDSLPATIDIGRGSPTGVEVYNHHAFPVRYHNAIFLGDWSMGRIVAVRIRPANGTYTARSEVFLQGHPLNVTDLAVGPDGALYFSTGGRGTEGGVYRVRWTGQAPPRPKRSGAALAADQPQPQSAWGRDRIALIKQQTGAAWDKQLVALAQDARSTPEDRCRALELMQLVGPFPKPQLLVEMSRDRTPEVRAKAAYFMGLHIDQQTHERLVDLANDSDPNVRRTALESLGRAGQDCPVELLVERLADPDRFVGWAAMRGLQRVPLGQWQSLVLASDNARVFTRGAAALAMVAADRSTYQSILERCSAWMNNFLEDEDFISLLRVMEVSLHRGQITGEEVPELRTQLAEEYPSLEPRMNRELVRLLVYLQAPVASRLIAELQNPEVPLAEKLHVAMHARFLGSGWSPGKRLDLLRYMETARLGEGGHSFKGYLDNASRDFVNAMSPEEKALVLTDAVDLPNAALSVLTTLPENPGDDIIGQLIQIDRELRANDNEAAKRLATGIVAILGGSKSPEAMAHLREVFDRDPDRRSDVAMGLAQEANGDNWPYLLRALPVCNPVATQEVLMQLASVPRAPEEPEPVRQVILAGLRLKDQGANHAIALLEKWSGNQLTSAEEPWDKAIGTWQAWFSEKFPDQPAPMLPTAAEGSRWTIDQLLESLAGPGAPTGNIGRGEQVFEKAQCIKCHRYGNKGEGIGPDLTTVSQRFQRKEILESVLFPSQVISDQYVSKTVVTEDGQQITGIVAPQGDDIVVLDSTGKKNLIKHDNVAEIAPSKKSAMPENLFDELTLEQIADLLAYLNKPPTR
jgi:putative heme-binding domain-containing protein